MSALTCPHASDSLVACYCKECRIRREEILAAAPPCRCGHKVTEHVLAGAFLAGCGACQCRDYAPRPSSGDAGTGGDHV